MRFEKYIIFIVVAILSTGCFSEYQSKKSVTSKRNIDKEAKKIYAAIQKEIKLDKDEFVYVNEDLPDPFQSIFDRKSTDTSNATALLTPNARNINNTSKIFELQRFELDELRLVGIVYGTTSNDRRALLKDPTGKTHNIKERAFVGKSFGRISSIKKDRVIVKEETYEITGKRIVKKIPIKLETEE